MKNILLKSSLLLLIASVFASFDLPVAWIKGGSVPDKYDMSVAKSAGQDGKDCATIKSIEKSVYGYGSLDQECKPGKFLGKRVKLTGYIKSDSVKDWAGLWFRVDGYNKDTVLSFDNMYDRGVKGTTGWKKYEVVLDVPNNATNLAYGALICGTGQIWLDNLNFEIVDASVKTTGNYDEIVRTPLGSTNLDFAK